MDVDDIFRERSVGDCRTLEVDLRAQASQKRTQLRLLVGESYRDLLRTADTVVQVRNAARALKQDIRRLADAAEDDRIERAVANLAVVAKDRAAANARTRERVCVRFLSDLRGLIVHYSKHDVVSAALLHELATRLAVSASDKVRRRVEHPGRILAAAIDATADVQAFSSAYAIFNKASPTQCLRHHLSLQRAGLCRATSLPDLVRRTLALVDAAPAFADLGLAFEKLARSDLVEAVCSLPEVDGELLRASLPTSLRGAKLSLDVQDLSARQAKREIERWLSHSSEAVAAAAEVVLQRQTDLGVVLTELRDIRRSLDEHGQEELYPVFEAAVQSLIRRRIEQQRAAIDALASVVQRLQSTQVQQQEDIWTRPLRWDVYDLSARRREVRHIVRGGAVDLGHFEDALTAALSQVRQDLAVLQASRQQDELHAHYAAEATEAVLRLHDMAQSGGQRQTAVRLSRVIRAAWPIEAAETSEPLLSIELPSYAIHTEPDLSATYAEGKPRLPSAACTNWLGQIESVMAADGLDLLRRRERDGVRHSIAQMLENCADDGDVPTTNGDAIADGTQTEGATDDNDSPTIEATSKETTKLQHDFDLAFIRQLIGQPDEAHSYAEKAVAQSRTAFGMLTS